MPASQCTSGLALKEWIVRWFGIVALVALWIISTGVAAVPLQIDISGTVLGSESDWLLPTPFPGSFAVSIVVDTKSYSSRELTFAHYGMGTGRRLDDYAFADVVVLSIAVRADNTVLWSDPAGLTLSFEGANPSAPSGLGIYFAFAIGTNSVNQSFLISYDTVPALTESQTLNDGDPLANILLRLGQNGFAGVSTVTITGDWGRLQGVSHEVQVSVPEPNVFWNLIMLGLFAAGFRVCSKLRRLGPRAR
jgi:hypothetical protein